MMKMMLIFIGSLIFPALLTNATEPPARGYASWYGESHRGRLMANGKQFNPDKLTAASWFYPLGTRVRVTLVSAHRGARLHSPQSILVTITDRGPANRLVRDGRIIDLTHAAFERLAPDTLGLIPIRVSQVQ
jgi:rare lipoprotein A